MLAGFQQFDIQATDPQVEIRTVVGGNGPPVLPMHGNPLTHVHWHLVAPRRASISRWIRRISPPGVK